MAENKEVTKKEIDDLIDNAVDLFNDGKHAECEVAVRAILEHQISRWQKIYCLALLADCIEDWYEAEKQRYNAETMYDNARFLWPPGKDSAVDRQLKDLREDLDDLRENQRACRPDDLDEYDDNEWMAKMYQKHSRVIEAEGDWGERLRLRSERIAAREEAEWHEMQERAREKSKEDAIQAARDMFDHAGVSIGDKSLDDVAASDQSQDRFDEEEDDKSKDKEDYDQDMEWKALIELNEKWYGKVPDSRTD